MNGEPSLSPGSRHVRLPAMFLWVVGGLGLLLGLLAVSLWILEEIVGVLGEHPGRALQEPERLVTGAVISIVTLGFSTLMIVGGLHMMRCRSYALARAACLVAIVPCLWNCGFLGVPIGVWGLVVLHRPDVKAAFAATRKPASPD